MLNTSKLNLPELNTPRTAFVVWLLLSFVAAPAIAPSFARAADKKGVSVADDVAPLEGPAPAETTTVPTANAPPSTATPTGITSEPAAEEGVEALLDTEDAKADQAATAKKKPAPEKPAAPSAPINTITDLATLQPFSDIAVIQRRYLPKTGRFELSGSGFTNLNNPFYNSLGASLRAAYYFREQYAFEVIGAVFGTMARQATEDLDKNRGITTDNVVTSKSFVAASFKWNPIYGKITWLNKGIVPFDLNFSGGVGMTQTTDGGSQPTLHLGTSQVFALSKWVAFRWDLMWNLYNATIKNDRGGEESLNQNDLFLGVGMSLYFPEATYR